MTEREKMLAGLLYNCGDPELLAQWHRAKDLIRDYNRTDSADIPEKDRILTELLGGRGKDLWITPPFFVDYGSNIYFGDRCEVNMNCVFLDDNVIRVGHNALIAPSVQIYTAFHPANAARRFGPPGGTAPLPSARPRPPRSSLGTTSGLAAGLSSCPA